MQWLNRAMLRLHTENTLDREEKIMSEWLKTSLIDIVELIGGGTPKTSKAEYWGGNINWLSVKDFNNENRYVYSTEKTITEEGLNNSSTKLLRKDDIIISARGTVGELSMIPFPMAFNQSCYGIRAKEGIDSTFLYYLIKHSVRKLKAMTHGSVFDTITRDTFANIDVAIPDIEMQQRVAKMLANIDDKVENNQRINNNLAEQSQAIFAEFMCKYPYVLSPLGDMAEIIDCLHSKKPKAVNGTTYQLLQLNNITDSGFLDLSSKYYISKSDYENWTRKCEIVEGDCVITNVGRIGAVSQAPNGTHAAMGRNMTCIRLRNDKPFYSYLITALLSPHIRREIMKNTDEGTIMGALNVKNIPLLLFPMFALPTMNALEDLLSPIRKAIEQNYLSNQMLSLLRDSLLPRLMSGELDVSNIEI